MFDGAGHGRAIHVNVNDGASLDNISDGAILASISDGASLVNISDDASLDDTSRFCTLYRRALSEFAYFLNIAIFVGLRIISITGIKL